ncbi:MAG: hypothetical protein HY398_00805 [Candidatus Doudnabacteria bacterium]|nr:hypothetical protein [Candidatus Doudnabacteria bacterium]
MEIAKIKKITAITVGAVILILGLLWFFQQQGFLRVFPTTESRRQKTALAIDESKFRPAEGLSPEQFQQWIKELYDLRAKVKTNPEDAQAWFDFGYGKESLNDHEGAVLAWEEAFRLQPLNFVVALNLANNYQYFLKDYPRAEFYYQKALDIQRGYTGAYQGLADLYRFNWKQKQSAFEPTMLLAIKNDPANQISYLSNLVEFFLEKNELQTAKDYYLEIKAMDAEMANELLKNHPELK